MQNGQVERANRCIGEALKTMLLESNPESQFWAEAVAMYVNVHNFLPRQKLGGRSAWSVFTGKSDPPPLRFAFGERVVFWTEQESGSKLLPHGSKGYFLGPAMAAAQTSFPGCHRVWHIGNETPNDRL